MNETDKKEKATILLTEIVHAVLRVVSNKDRVMILNFIAKEEKATFGEIRRSFNLNNNILRFHLRKIEEAKLIYQEQKRRPYKITDFGKLINESFNLLVISLESDQVDEILKSILRKRDK